MSDWTRERFRCFWNQKTWWGGYRHPKKEDHEGMSNFRSSWVEPLPQNIQMHGYSTGSSRTPGHLHFKLHRQLAQSQELVLWHRDVILAQKTMYLRVVWDLIMMQAQLSLGLCCHLKMLTTDASLTGWGAALDGRPAQGIWRGHVLDWHFNCLKIMALFRALKYFFQQ